MMPITNNPFCVEESNDRRRQESHVASDVFFILLFCFALLGMAVLYMNLQRQISSVNDAIASIEKSNRELKSLLANQERIRDAFISQKVVEYARSHKMVLPAPGQVCVVTQNELNMVAKASNYRKPKKNMTFAQVPVKSNENR